MSTTDQDTRPADSGGVLTTSEVAALWRVESTTVKRWVKAGRMDGAVFATPGGHYRFREAAVLAMLNDWSRP